ncbi:MULTISPECIES: M6 family metalloprotease domain-containing protein [unclassified Pseudoxanthomonas]|uniref:M6 family metalloprotease domain-containing protein n=1 Tax=unclassified Pseudoxanthomonas TaxID=2645906 RepID=UPI00307837E0
MELLKQERIPRSLTFKQFFDVWLCDRRGEDLIGLDDGSVVTGPAKAVQLIKPPDQVLSGIVRTLVLLVDFVDRPHAPEYTTKHYRDMLFGNKQAYPAGSMREYYRSISNYGDHNGIDIQGDVKGWFRMPQPLSYYTQDQSGLGDSFPKNAMGMARDAIKAAKAAGVDFSGYDVLGEGIVTALFIVHAGRGAEETGAAGDIWSHKAVIPSMKVAKGVSVTTYLTVPEDSKVGVCAHEWGHLAARWADYYDTGEEENSRSNGLGHYCLMSSGSWANRGSTPTLPTAMLRRFHRWIETEVVEQSTSNLALRPAAGGGGCLLVRNAARMSAKQYILLEYRRRIGQDKHLPDEGVAIYVIDEKIKDVNDENLLAIELIQADDKRDLARTFQAGNTGDPNDLYPHGNLRQLGRDTKPPLRLSDRTTWSGVTLTIKGKPGDATMRVDVEIDSRPVRSKKRTIAKQRTRRIG